MKNFMLKLSALASLAFTSSCVVTAAENQPNDQEIVQLNPLPFYSMSSWRSLPHNNVVALSWNSFLSAQVRTPMFEMSINSLNAFIHMERGSDENTLINHILEIGDGFLAVFHGFPWNGHTGAITTYYVGLQVQPTRSVDLREIPEDGEFPRSWETEYACHLFGLGFRGVVSWAQQHLSTQGNSPRVTYETLSIYEIENGEGLAIINTNKFYNENTYNLRNALDGAWEFIDSTIFDDFD